MTQATPISNSASAMARPRYVGPVWTLLLLAPFIAEVLSGSTRLSYIFVLIPEVMVWGVGALLCRELVRRWRGGVTSLLFLGLGLSIAEEFIIQQTSLAPLPWPGANAGFGRLWGVNWPYFLFMLGYESVWVVLIPVQVTELFFPSRRTQPWLSKKALIALPLVFLFGSFLAWYGWTQQALPRMHVAPYHPPILTVALGLVAIVLLACFAYVVRMVGTSPAPGSKAVVPSWVGFSFAFVFAAGWWSIMQVLFTPRPWATACELIPAACAWAAVAYLLLFRSSRTRWTDQHRWAVTFAATLATMAVPYLSLKSWLKPDIIAKLLFDALVLAGFLVLASRIRYRSKD